MEIGAHCWSEGGKLPSPQLQLHQPDENLGPAGVEVGPADENENDPSGRERERLHENQRSI